MMMRDLVSAAMTAIDGAFAWLARMLDGEEAAPAPAPSLQTLVAVLRAHETLEEDSLGRLRLAPLEEHLPNLGGLSWTEWEILAARADAALERGL